MVSGSSYLFISLWSIRSVKCQIIISRFAAWMYFVGSCGVPRFCSTCFFRFVIRRIDFIFVVLWVSYAWILIDVGLNWISRIRWWRYWDTWHSVQFYVFAGHCSGYLKFVLLSSWGFSTVFRRDPSSYSVPKLLPCCPLLDSPPSLTWMTDEVLVSPIFTKPELLYSSCSLLNFISIFNKCLFTSAYHKVNLPRQDDSVPNKFNVTQIQIWSKALLHFFSCFKVSKKR